MDECLYFVKPSHVNRALLFFNGRPNLPDKMGGLKKTVHIAVPGRCFVLNVPATAELAVRD